MSERLDLSAAELQRVLEAERSERPFLVLRDLNRRLAVIALSGADVFTIGRRSANDLCLAEDPLASRTHARLERIGEDWLVSDPGISRNGTFVNGLRVSDHQLLHDGDRLRVGETLIEFHHPGRGDSQPTDASAATLTIEHLTPTQRRVLLALSRPLREGGAVAAPASNSEIAEEVFLGTDAVKAHLREMYRRFDITLPQNQKRARLAELALQMGLTDRH